MDYCHNEMGRGSVVVPVGGDGVDGGVVCFHLAHRAAGVGGPELDDAGSASGHQNLSAGQVSQPADPVLVSVVDRPERQEEGV